MRPLCTKCSQRPAAVNYKKAGKTYYRKKCELCLRYGGPSGYMPKWHVAGYRINKKCDKCGRTYFDQIDLILFDIVCYLDICKFSNLKTVCANCQRSLHLEGIRWKQGDLVPDF